MDKTQVFHLKDGEVIFERDEEDIIVGVYINDTTGEEVVSWTEDEWKDDRLALSATMNTIAVVLTEGVGYIR